MLADRLRPWLDGLTEHAFVVSHGGVARVLMTLIAGVAGEGGRRADQWREGACLENGGCRWIG